jgi:hypothetical protein
MALSIKSSTWRQRITLGNFAFVADAQATGVSFKAIVQRLKPELGKRLTARLEAGAPMRN